MTKRMPLGNWRGWVTGFLAAGLLSVAGGGAFALGDRPVRAGDMKGIEYAWDLPLALGFRNQLNAFPTAAGAKLDGVKMRAGVHRKMEVVYFDTPSKTLMNQGLILRVRKDLTRPDRSRITLKSRHPDLARVLYIPHTKGEIDVKGGNSSYSLSLDSNFRNADVDLATVTGPEFLAYLEKSHRRVHAEVMAALGNQSANLKRTPMVHLHRFRGELTDGPGRGTEVDVDVMGVAGSRQALAAELAFKISSANRKRGDEIVAWMNERLKASGVATPSGGSKTNRVLNLGLR